MPYWGSSNAIASAETRKKTYCQIEMTKQRRVVQPVEKF